jgi:hypothetical protein
MERKESQGTVLRRIAAIGVNNAVKESKDIETVGLCDLLAKGGWAGTVCPGTSGWDDADTAELRLSIVRRTVSFGPSASFGDVRPSFASE